LGPVESDVTEFRRQPGRVRQLQAAAEACGDQMTMLAEQQAALRRVATLVARGASPPEVFSAVADELARVLHVLNAGLLRYEPDGSGYVVAVGYERGITQMPGPGEHIPLAGDDVGALVLRTGRAARIDNHATVSGPEAERIRAEGIGSIVGLPIIVDGRLWGAAIVGSKGPDPLPPDTEARVGDFADLVATAIANAAARSELRASRDELAALAEQQAALRRVATLVARGAGPLEVFSAVADELARCLHAGHAAVYRYDADDALVPLALYREDRLQTLPKGLRLALAADHVAARVLRTGATARMDRDDDAPGPHAGRIRGLGIHSAVGAPIIVDGHVWGAAIVGSTRPEPLPADTDERIAEFAELLATAITAAATRDELAKSRGRIVAAADQARRRLERNLHDGAQQRAVSLGLQLRMAEDSVPTELAALKEQLSQIASGLIGLCEELREISHGIHPAIVSTGGLGPALKSLARRSTIPVTLDVGVLRRLRDVVEVAAYYVVAEAFTNAAKHAQASQLEVTVNVDDENVHLLVRDDGVGGADFDKGSGLIGLKDRVEALGGRLTLASPVKKGTSLTATIPLHQP
jgi:signal transduction histidine kinase